MSLSKILLSFCLTFVLASAGELPWIGVSLESPKNEDRKAVDLAEGVSLKVNRVISGSPLAKAGGQAGDLWWKFDGQILVNKRQMLVLLRTKSPGDSVEIDYFRNKKQKNLSLVLVSKEAPSVYQIGTRSPKPDASRILAKREEIARVTTGGQDLSLKREGEVWRFEVLEEGTSVLSCLVSESDLSEKVPPKWLGAFLVLKLTLEQQVSQPNQTTKQRVRYVPRKESSEE